MNFCQIKCFFKSAVNSVASTISSYAVNPPKDFTRRKKLVPERLITFLVSEGSGSSKNELLDFFDNDPLHPSNSAFCQQRAKLKPEALKEVFLTFNKSVNEYSNHKKYRFIAADGSTVTYFSSTTLSSDEYHTNRGNAVKGSYSIHVNAMFDLDTEMYTAAVLQPVKCYDEYSAFCEMVDNHPLLKDIKNIYIGDRGYCSYNNMAHVVESGQLFLFRSKDITSKGILKNFDYPDNDTFDIPVTVTLVRSHSKKISGTEGYVRFVDSNASFDYINYGSLDTYKLSFRIVRLKLSDNSYECLVTNLPVDEFPSDELKELYFRRWSIESSYRKLKYTIGLNNFHSCRPECVKQEIWGRLICYNITSTLIKNAIIKKNDKNKHYYKINFSVAVHLCRQFLRPGAEKRQLDLMALLMRELIPIRNGRKFDRLATAHFRKPKYFIYRAS